MKELGIAFAAGAVGGYLLCLARRRIADAARVLILGYEAKAKAAAAHAAEAVEKKAA